MEVRELGRGKKAECLRCHEVFNWYGGCDLRRGRDIQTRWMCAIGLDFQRLHNMTSILLRYIGWDIFLYYLLLSEDRQRVKVLLTRRLPLQASGSSINAT